MAVSCPSFQMQRNRENGGRRKWSIVKTLITSRQNNWNKTENSGLRMTSCTFQTRISIQALRMISRKPTRSKKGNLLYNRKWHRSHMSRTQPLWSPTLLEWEQRSTQLSGQLSKISSQGKRKGFSMNFLRELLQEKMLFRSILPSTLETCLKIQEGTTITRVCKLFFIL